MQAWAFLAGIVSSLEHAVGKFERLPNPSARDTEHDARLSPLAISQ